MDIKKWKDIEKDYKGTLLLGNGASISIEPNFHYTNLYDEASELSNSSISELFQEINTTDFELVMSYLIDAKLVNEKLNIDDRNKIDEAYKNCQRSLIDIIHHIHPNFVETLNNHSIEGLGHFAKRFKTVISLNYDLLLYAAHIKINNFGEHEFKDCFALKSGCNNFLGFDDDIDKFSQPRNGIPATLIFYLHGSLSLVNKNTDGYSLPFKIKSRNINNMYIDRIGETWETHPPLFVCEGKSNIKREKIQSNPYLNTVYSRVLPSAGSNLTIYGWSFGPEDKHIIDKLKTIKKLKRVAVSVWGEDRDMIFRNHIEQIFNSIDRSIELSFFEAEKDFFSKIAIQEMFGSIDD